MVSISQLVVLIILVTISHSFDSNSFIDAKEFVLSGPKDAIYDVTVQINGYTRVSASSAAGMVDENANKISDSFASIKDVNSQNGVRFGVSSASTLKGFIRLAPMVGDGIGIINKSPSSEASTGVFVSAADGRVGIGHFSPTAGYALHVKVNSVAKSWISPAETPTVSVLRTSKSIDEYSIIFNTDGKLKYSIGHSTEDRNMVFSTAGPKDLGDLNPSKITYSSGFSQLLSFSSDFASYLYGSMWLGQLPGSFAPNSGSGLMVAGVVHLEADVAGRALLYFPTSGKHPSLHIRGVKDPTKTSSTNTNVFIGGSGRVGINTVLPKTILDVRGHINLENDEMAAVIIFPRSGILPNFFIRSSDDPTQYDANDERFFIGACAKSGSTCVGIGSIAPTSGLTLEQSAGENSKQNCLLIKNGNLRLWGSIYDLTNTKYMVALDDTSFIKSVNIKNYLGIGGKWPGSLWKLQGNSVNLEGTNPTVHIQNTKNDKAVFHLNKWNILHSQNSVYRIQPNVGIKSQIDFSTEGGLGLGPIDLPTASSPRPYGIEIKKTEGILGADVQSIAIKAGNLRLWGDIKHMTSPQFVLSLSATSRIQSLSVQGNLGIGMSSSAKPEHRVHINNVLTATIGKIAFMYGDLHRGGISINEFRVGTGKDRQSLLQNPDVRASSVQFGDGTVSLEATSIAQSAVMVQMFSVDASINSAILNAATIIIGPSKQPQPLAIVGAGSIKGAEDKCLAFGSTINSYGQIGSGPNNIFLASMDGTRKFILGHTTPFAGINIDSPKSELDVVNPDIKDSQESWSSSVIFTSLSSAKNNVAFSCDEIAGAVGCSSKFSSNGAYGNAGSFSMISSAVMSFIGKGNNVFQGKKTVFEAGSGNVGIRNANPIYPLEIGSQDAMQDIRVSGKWTTSLKGVSMESYLSLLDVSNLSNEHVDIINSKTDMIHVLKNLKQMVFANDHVLDTQESNIKNLEVEIAKYEKKM